MNSFRVSSIRPMLESNRDLLTKFSSSALSTLYKNFIARYVNHYIENQKSREVQKSKKVTKGIALLRWGKSAKSSRIFRKGINYYGRV